MTTPREQITEHAKTAAKKVRDAIEELHKAVGVESRIDVNYISMNTIDSSTAIPVLTSVTVDVGGVRVTI